MTHHFVNILTWRHFLEPTNDEVLYIDGFLLKLLIRIKTGERFTKNSGLILYRSKVWREDTLFLTRDGQCGFTRELQLPLWEQVQDIYLGKDLINQILTVDEIVIGISSTKQDVLARHIFKINPSVDIYCLGAAVYSKPLFRSDTVMNTLGSLFLSDPLRTTHKLRKSIVFFLLDLVKDDKDIQTFIGKNIKR